MCIGGGYSAPETPKVDPAPTTVQNSDIDTGTERKKKRNGYKSTVNETRNTILGELGGGSTGNGTRKFLGSKD